MNAIDYLPENLRELSVMKEIVSDVQHILDTHAEELKDISDKYRDPTRNTRKLLDEYGFSYLYEVLDSLGYSVSDLANVLALLHFLKGTRTGIHLFVRLLKVEFWMLEWWEVTPGNLGFGHNFGYNFGSRSFLSGLQVGEYGLFLSGKPSQVVIDAILQFSDSYVLPKIVIEFGSEGFGHNFGHTFGQSYTQIHG